MVDNNILVDLTELDRLDLLFGIFENVYIPKVIYDEELPDEISTKLGEYEYDLVNISTTVGYDLYFKLTEDRKYRNLSRPDKIAVSIAKQEAVFLYE